MMTLNHLNLPVTDVAATRSFFEQYFDFPCVETKGDDMIAVLVGKDGFTLVLMANTFNRNGQTTYPDALHIGFLVKSKEEVIAAYHRLENSGLLKGITPGNLRGGYGFYFNAPGPILTEISCAGE